MQNFIHLNESNNKKLCLLNFVGGTESFDAGQHYRSDSLPPWLGFPRVCKHRLKVWCGRYTILGVVQEDCRQIPSVADYPQVWEVNSMDLGIGPTNIISLDKCLLVLRVQKRKVLYSHKQHPEINAVWLLGHASAGDGEDASARVDV